MRKSIIMCLLIILASLFLVGGGLTLSSMQTAVSDSTTWSSLAASSYDGGAGTESNPYLIRTAEQLAKLSKDAGGGYFKQTANIDLTAHQWTPNQSVFSGDFDGNGFTIKMNLTIQSTWNYIGLFGNTTGKLQNITLSGTMTGTCPSSATYLGSIVGYGGTIVNCTSSVNINVSFANESRDCVLNMGGVAGFAQSISKCTNTGAITLNHPSTSVRKMCNNLGGVVGLVNTAGAIVEGCKNTGDIAMTGVAYPSTYDYNTYSTAVEYLGGVIGNGANVFINTSENEGDLLFDKMVVDSIGGVLGYYYSDTTTSIPRINRCTNRGNILNSFMVSFAGYCGGIVGSTSSYDIVLNVANCANYGNVSGGFVGGICGSADDMVLEYCFNMGDIKNVDAEKGCCGGLVGIPGFNVITVRKCVVKDCTITGGGKQRGTSAVIAELVYAAAVTISDVSCINVNITTLSTSTDVNGIFLGYSSLHKKKASSLQITACSFVGTCDVGIGEFVARVHLQSNNYSLAGVVSNSYVKINNYKCYSSDSTTSSLNSYYSVVPKMNNGYPMQVGLYAAAKMAYGTTSVMTTLTNLGFTAISTGTQAKH